MCAWTWIEPNPLIARKLLNEPVDRTVFNSEGWQLIRRPEGDGKVDLRIPLVSPESRRAERLLLKIWSEMLPDTS